MRRTSPLSRGCLDDPAYALSELHRRIGSSFEAAAFGILARSPAILQSFLSAIQPVYDKCVVHSAAERLRADADSLMHDPAPFSDHLSWLTDRGFSREETRQIRYVVEVFHNLEPVFAVLTSLARQWLSGGWGREALPEAECSRIRHAFPGPIAFADRDALPAGHGSAHLFHRAIGAWPEYAVKVADDCSSEPRALLGNVSAILWSRATEMGSKVAAMLSDGPPVEASCELLAGLDECLWSSCDAIALAATLRQGFIRAEQRVRSRCSDQRSPVSNI